MSSLEQEYYEFDGFWNPNSTPLGDEDLKRVADIYTLVPPDTASLLDVGCGNGLFCNYVNSQGRVLKVVGLDRSKTALKYVGTEKIQGSITEIPFPDKWFDCVTSLEVLEHLPIKTFEDARKEIARVAKKYIIVSVPNSQILGEGMTQCSSCKTKFDPDLHMRSFNGDSMRSLFSNYGFGCQQVEEIGHYSNYMGISMFWKMMQRQPEPTMASPLCPICGFSNEKFLSHSNGAGRIPAEHGDKSQAGAAARAKGIIKKFWPKEKGSRWLVGLYARAL